MWDQIYVLGNYIFVGWGQQWICHQSWMITLCNLDPISGSLYIVRHGWSNLQSVLHWQTYTVCMLLVVCAPKRDHACACACACVWSCAMRCDHGCTCVCACIMFLSNFAKTAVATWVNATHNLAHLYFAGSCVVSFIFHKKHFAICNVFPGAFCLHS